MQGKKFSDRLMIAAGKKTRERNFWLKKLSGEWVKSILPDDYKENRNEYKPLPGQEYEYQGDAIEFKLADELCFKLMKLSNRSDVKLHIILAAGLILLIHKYTGMKDIIIGAPIYRQDTEGEFINTLLVLRHRVNKEMTFKELLLQVRETIVEAAEHQGYPVEILPHELNMPLYGKDFPLFDIALLLENIHERKYIQYVNPNVLLSFLRTGNAITGEIEYNTRLYRSSTIERIISHFKHLLQAVILNIDTPVTDIEMVTDDEKKQLVFDFNNWDEEYPKEKTIHQLFQEQAERAGDQIAVMSMPHAITYRELNKKANQLAHVLKERGVKPGTIVGIVVESSIEMVIGILGTLKAGGAYLPIDPEYPEERIFTILNDAEVSLLLTTPGIQKRYSFTGLQGLQAARVDPYMTAPRRQGDFDGLPHPDRSLIDFEKYSQYIGHAMVRKAVSIQGTRGCPYNCAYCHRTMQKKNVARSAENIFEEVKYYYDRGVRRFSFVDEIFNLNTKNSTRFFQLVLENRLDVQLFFPNGMRADRLTKEYIDLMVEAGTVDLGLALETASPRLQKLIRKNLDIDKLRENAEYFCSKYPNVILELFTMHGFPTETEEEAMSTLDFIKSLHWVHFPYVFLLKIHPSTDMMKLALDNGISREAIERSMTAAFHEIPETLPFPKRFTRQYVARFMNEYFLSRERLVHVLPYQLKIASESELARKYDNYLPATIRNISDLLENVGISRAELGNLDDTRSDSDFVPDYHAMRKKRYPAKEKRTDAFRLLLLDLSVPFSTEKHEILHGEITEPLGAIYLLTYLNEIFGERISGKIAKSKIDFDSYEALKEQVCDFKPDLIGIRTLSYFKDFFHRTVAKIKEWGIDAAVVAGGPYGTSDYHLVLQDPHVDLTVLREGEFTLAELVEKMMANHNKRPGEEVLQTITGIAFIKKTGTNKLKKRTRQMICLDRLPGTPDRYPINNPGNINGPNDLLYLISTSGSTGKPKSVMLEHRNVNNLMHFQFSKTDISFGKVLQFASPGFDVCAQEIFSTLLSGGELHVVGNDKKNDIYQLLDYVRDHCLDTLFLPPAFLKLIFSEPDYITRFPHSVRHIIAAGEQLVVTEPLKEYLREHRVYLHNHYGPSETHVVTTLTIEPDSRYIEFPSIGKPISNTRVYILDENKHVKPIGAVGELYISGHNVGRGYYKQESLTNETFIDDPFVTGERMYRTGDLGRWLPGGTIEFLGRVDHQVKIRGYRIEPGEIEHRLKKIDFVKEAVVLDRENVNKEKYLCAYIVADQKGEVSDVRALLADCLPDYMIPAHFIQLEQLPLTPNGKINRKALPMPEIGLREEYVAPANEIEKKLAKIWAEVLELDAAVIGTNTNFFELGGHSLKAAILISKIHKVFDVKITLGEMFRQPFIKGLAGYIKKAESETFIAIEPAPKKESYSLSSAQKRVFIQQHMNRENINYNLPVFMWVEGMLDKKKLERVFKQLISRHENLRTSFEIEGGEPVQEIGNEVDFSIEYYDLTAKTREDTRRRSEKGLLQNQDIIHDFIRPFDLSRAPLMRVGLIETGAETHLLMVDMHHIITDGTSTGILINEFMALYKGEHLTPLTLHYKDYSEWQHRLLESGKLKKQKQYWLNQFEKETPLLNLPTDFSRPPVRDCEGGRFHFEIERSLTDELKKFVLETETTIHTVLMAVQTILLFKYSGQEDIVVGTGAAGRRHADLENGIGMFINMLPIRNQPHKEKTCIRFLEEVKKNTLDALDNQDYPFDELVKELNLQGDPARNPLFDTVFQLQNIELPEMEIPGLKLKPYEYETNISRFDLVIYGTENHDTMDMLIVYSTQLFKKSTAREIGKNFIEILHQVLHNKETPLKNISITIDLLEGKSNVFRENQLEFGF
jgi:amino acid adenylation domain-containing protein